MASTVSKSQRFLQAFGEIERSLRRGSSSPKDIGFYRLVDLVGVDNPVIRRFKVDLKQYADLRNAIVHDRIGGVVIAEPHERVVQRIETIAALIQRPPRVLPVFERRVLTLRSDDTLEAALKTMLKHSFSQIPVISREDFIGLLTANTITRWLASRSQSDWDSITPISSVLDCAEDVDNHCFLPGNATIFDAMDSFHTYEELGKRLEAVLITESGKSSSKIKGIITVSDLPRILKEMEKRKTTVE